MRKDTLISIKERIGEAYAIPIGHYLKADSRGLPCFCTVGHIFLEGGATVKEMKETLMTTKDKYLLPLAPNLMSVDELLGFNIDVNKWLENAGFDPEQGRDRQFLFEIQQINDEKHTLQERKSRILERIDEEIQYLDKGEEIL
jgi:hypothetical protein